MRVQLVVIHSCNGLPGRIRTLIRVHHAHIRSLQRSLKISFTLYKQLSQRKNESNRPLLEWLKTCSRRSFLTIPKVPISQLPTYFQFSSRKLWHTILYVLYTTIPEFPTDFVLRIFEKRLNFGGRGSKRASSNRIPDLLE